MRLALHGLFTLTYNSHREESCHTAPYAPAPAAAAEETVRVNRDSHCYGVNTTLWRLRCTVNPRYSTALYVVQAVGFQIAPTLMLRRLQCVQYCSVFVLYSIVRCIFACGIKGRNSVYTVLYSLLLYSTGAYSNRGVLFLRCEMWRCTVTLLPILLYCT